MEMLQGGSEEYDGDNRFDEHEAEIVAEVASSRLLESPNETKVTDNPPFRYRKVRSAASRSTGFGRSNILDGIPRPYSAAGADALLSSRGGQSKKKSATSIKKTARDSKTPREDRPRSAGVNEWGDFDTDRLLRDDFEEPLKRMPPDPQDRQRSRSRKCRRSTPAPSSPPSSPREGYLTFSNESKEVSKPTMQVLKQKTIETLNLDLVAHTNPPSSRANAPPKPLLSRASMERLMSPHPGPATSHVPSSTPLFGTEISNTPTNRAAIFCRLTDLWSLISRRADNELEAANLQTKSPLECNTVMVKVCKTVGISLTSSVATRLSFWNANEQGVDFDSFCDLVIQCAIQPALHHFNLDNSIAEYVAALDLITQSLVAMEPARRLKQLNEIQPVFMSWKAGVTPRYVQAVEGTPPQTLLTAEKVRRALEASASQHMLAHQLPSEEARVTHVANIRRKVQLYKSWQSTDEKKVSRPVTNLLRGGLICSDEQRLSTSEATDLAEMLDRACTVFPASAGAEVFLGDERDQTEFSNEIFTDKANDPGKAIRSENEEVLVCGSCSIRRAVLWCSSCFTVNCQMCWQEVHFCTVDMSSVSSETSAREPLLGPSALGIKTRSENATLSPPVAMIYLPTRAMKSGTLAKGVRHLRNISNQVNAIKGEIPLVVANAILPSLPKSRSTGTLPRHFERPQVESTPARATDSVAYSTLGNQTSGSTELAKRLQKHHSGSRSKLHLAPVSLDAELLLSTTPDRRR
ncbi:hypothetical protein GN244_ATG14995 [Phytophthora infestans]|uniref:B box-type domain-containing protein n=1 Tax=Phytophthora infestans TaxID=4787 RepID=A0A833WPL4_PHYIN|nr:hypothetical protein GN244_ATG14995 [Phytophthora infestans]